MADLEVNYNIAGLDDPSVSAITATVTNDAGDERVGSPVILSDSVVPKKYIGSLSTIQVGDTIQYFHDDDLIGSETYQPEVVLGASGLEGISIDDPGGVASNFSEMMVQLWRRFFKKVSKDNGYIKTYDDLGSTVVTTQEISTNGSLDVVDEATD